MSSSMAMPLLVVNLGCEMVYILEQRLKAQNIPADKACKVKNANDPSNNSQRACASNACVLHTHAACIAHPYAVVASVHMSDSGTGAFHSSAEWLQGLRTWHAWHVHVHVHVHVRRCSTTSSRPCLTQAT